MTSRAQEIVDHFDETYGATLPMYDDLRVEHDGVHANPVLTITLADFTCLELLEMGVAATARLVHLVQRASDAASRGNEGEEFDMMMRAFACRHVARAAWDAHALLHDGDDAVMDATRSRGDGTEQED